MGSGNQISYPGEQLWAVAFPALGRGGQARIPEALVSVAPGK